MSPEEILKHLEQRVNLLQRRITELGEQREEIERQIKNYKELMRYYRGVYEAEQGVGVQGQISSEAIKRIEEALSAHPGVTTERVKKRERTVTWAVFQILAKKDIPMRIEEICEVITQQYPDIAKGAKNLFHGVEVVCLRASRNKILERVAPRRYSIVKKYE